VEQLADQFFSEAFVSILNAPSVADLLCERCRGHCLSIDSSGNDRLLLFEDGRAILRPSDSGLQMRVEAGNLVVFCGVRMLLQGQLATVPTAARAVGWRPAGREPFVDQETDGARRANGGRILEEASAASLE